MTRQRSRSRLGSPAEVLSIEGIELPSVRSMRLIWVRLPALLLFLGSLWVLYNLFSSARFRISEVSISGTNLLQSAELERSLDVAHKSIFRVDSKGLEMRLLREFGCIKRVEVTPRLPNRLFVTIEEHEVKAVWESDGQYWWIGSEGRVLGRASGPGNLLVIHDLERFAPDPGARILGVPWAYALEMRQALPEIKAYDYALDKGLIIYVTTAQWPVYLGYRGDVGEKVAILRALVESLVTKGIDVEYIDLRNERRPIYKKR